MPLNVLSVIRNSTKFGAFSHNKLAPNYRLLRLNLPEVHLGKRPCMQD